MCLLAGESEIPGEPTSGTSSPETADVGGSDVPDATLRESETSNTNPTHAVVRTVRLPAGTLLELLLAVLSRDSAGRFYSRQRLFVEAASLVSLTVLFEQRNPSFNNRFSEKANHFYSGGVTSTQQSCCDRDERL